MTDKDVLAIVISFNGIQHTKKCLKALRDQSESVRIVIWDNNSTADTKTALQKLSDVEVEFSDINYLWTPGINRAIDKYWDNEPYIMYMNNDIYLPNNAVSNLKATASEVNVGQTAPWGTRLGGLQDIVSHPDLRIPNMEINGSKRHPVRASYLMGACIMMKKDVWDDVGPLNEETPLGADDHDYSLRVKDAGYGLYVERSVICDHEGHASAKKKNGREQWDKWGDIGWDAFNKKWTGYFRDETEAFLCHWGSHHYPGWERGTGWLSMEEQKDAYKVREEFHLENLNRPHYKDVKLTNIWEFMND